MRTSAPTPGSPDGVEKNGVGAVQAARPPDMSCTPESGTSAHGLSERVEIQKFEAEGVTLYLADNRDVRELLDADALISDPPYGMAWENNQRFSGGNTRRGKGTKHDPIIGDNQPFDPSSWLWPKKPVVLWGANHFWDKLPRAAALVWQKRNDYALGTFLSDAELAYLSVGSGVYVFRKTFAGSSRAVEGGVGAYEGSLHPNQKPVSLVAWCIERAKVPVGALVSDPYAGSGSTAIACIRTSRRFVGAEKDPQHFATAVARIQRELQQRDLFWGGGGAEHREMFAAEKEPNDVAEPETQPRKTSDRRAEK